MSSEMTIRSAISDDIPELAGIIRNAFYDVAVRFGLTETNCPKHPSNCKAQWIEEALEKGVRYFILEAEGIPCGCVALEQANSQICYMERLAVLPNRQRQGRGWALVDHALNKAGSLGASQVDIGIIAEQTELKDWYKKIGFVEQRKARFPHLPFEVLFMSINITKAKIDES